jgi:hypothetical protein
MKQLDYRLPIFLISAISLFFIISIIINIAIWINYKNNINDALSLYSMQLIIAGVPVLLSLMFSGYQIIYERKNHENDKRYKLKNKLLLISFIVGLSFAVFNLLSYFIIKLF